MRQVRLLRERGATIPLISAFPFLSLVHTSHGHPCRQWVDHLGGSPLCSQAYMECKHCIAMSWALTSVGHIRSFSSVSRTGSRSRLRNRLGRALEAPRIAAQPLGLCFHTQRLSRFLGRNRLRACPHVAIVGARSRPLAEALGELLAARGGRRRRRLLGRRHHGLHGGAASRLAFQVRP